jgi:hypothetical protein
MLEALDRDPFEQFASTTAAEDDQFGQTATKMFEDLSGPDFSSPRIFIRQGATQLLANAHRPWRTDAIPAPTGQGAHRHTSIDRDSLEDEGQKGGET